MTEREDMLLEHALRLAEEYGFQRVSRALLAEAAGVSETLVSYYWTAPELQTAIMRRAVDRRCMTVLAQGLVARHEVALAAPERQRRAAAAALAARA